MHDKESLIAFEKRVAGAFLEKRIAAPIHLAGGAEDQLLEVFKDVKPGDWKFSGWRSHYHALLSGIPEEELFVQILEGRSMFVSSKEHRFLSSAIVAGILPIALGVALGIKLNGGDERCFVFVGDMTARTGLFHEFIQYADGHKLPVRVVVENNFFSTNTPTEKVWGGPAPYVDHTLPVTRYKYVRVYPHVGVGVNVQF